MRDVVATATTVACVAFEHDLELRCVDVLRPPGARRIVLRCAVVDPPFGVPASVIVKADRCGDDAIEREWAALSFLGTFAEAASFSPFLFGGDRERRLLVLEDWGDMRGRTLADLLAGADVSAARAALQDYAQRLGTLHAATRAEATNWSAFAAELAPAVAAAEWRDPFPHLDRCGVEFGVPMPSRAREDIELLGEILGGASRFRALAYGGTDFRSLAWTPSGVKCVDFSDAGFRHAIPDVISAPLRAALQPELDGVVPISELRSMLRTYRTVLAANCPEARDDAMFGVGVVAAALAAVAPGFAASPQTWTRGGGRGRRLALLDGYLALAADVRAASALFGWFVDLRDALSARWPDGVRPGVCGAFREGVR